MYPLLQESLAEPLFLGWFRVSVDGREGITAKL